jgi:hypothetical protein
LTVEEYLTAFDHWLSWHIHAAVKAGKDFAFRDRSFNFDPKLDEEGVAWAYVFLEPGACPPPGHAWTVYRLHEARVEACPVRPPPAMPRRRRRMIEDLAERVFTGASPPLKAKPVHLRAVT